MMNKQTIFSFILFSLLNGISKISTPIYMFIHKKTPKVRFSSLAFGVCFKLIIRSVYFFTQVSCTYRNILFTANLILERYLLRLFQASACCILPPKVLGIVTSTVSASLIASSSASSLIN